MTIAPQPKLYDRSGVYNPYTGKKSKGLKQKKEFSDLQVQAKADRTRREQQERLNKTHPKGLAERRNSDGSIIPETRAPTSGKGLAYAVEAVLAYCNDPKKLDTPKRSRDVLSRFINRTPKLRDSADCAITKAVQSVNWKNYKLETYDNNLPKGPIKLLINISGPYVHLMFKSQSKNALADDEELLKEIKYCLEAIGRRLRTYLNRRANIRKIEKRAGLIERYIPIFVQSLYNITMQGDGKYKEKISETELETLMKDAIGVKKIPSISKEIEPTIKKEEIEKEKQKKTVVEWEKTIDKKEYIPKKPEPRKEFLSERTLRNWTVNELKEYCIENDILIAKPSTVRKSEIIKKIQEFYTKEEPEVITPSVKERKEPIKLKPVITSVVPEKRKQLRLVGGKETTQPVAIKKPIVRAPAPKPEPTQIELPIITTEKILDALSDEWQPITSLIFKMKIKEMMDARFLQIKLKELERKNSIVVSTIKNKKNWKLK